MGVIDEVKQRVDIIEVIGQYTKLTKAGRTFRGLCPFHSEKHGSFFVYPEQQSWHCFGACSTGGDVFSFLMKKEGMGFGDALRLLAQKTGVAIPSESGREEERGERAGLYQISEAAAQYFHNLLLNSPVAEKLRSYITGRGISPKTIADFQLGFSQDSWESLNQYLLERNYTEGAMLAAGLILQAENGRTHDRFRGRLMFPIHDARGHTTGFGARALDDTPPKYLNSPQTPVFDKSGSLYGIDLASAAIRQRDVAVIVEGYIDVIIAHQYGFNNVVASMGTAITEKQVSTLRKLSKNLILVLDADAAGVEAMLRGGALAVKPSEEDTAPRYKSSPQTSHLNEADTRTIVGRRIINLGALDIDVRIVVLPENKDPDEIIKGDINVWKNLLAEAMPVYDYIFERSTSELDLATAKDKSLAVERLLPVVAEIINPVRQAHYLQKLARLVKVSEQTLENSLSKMKPGPSRQKAQQPKPEAVERALRPFVSSPLEQDCLTLLLHYPELKDKCGDLRPEYFQNSENREIFRAWQQTSNLASLKEKLDTAIHEHLDSLAGKSLPPTQIEQRYADYTRNLRERFLKSSEAERAEVYALERETRGPGADLAKLEENGIEPSRQLREVFSQKSPRRSEPRR